MMKIIITPRTFQDKGSHQIKRLRKLGYDVVMNTKNQRYTREEVMTLIEDADAILTGNDPLDREVLGKAKKLKVISKYGVGLDNIDVSYAEDHHIKVCKAIGANTISVAEMVMLMILAASRDFLTLANNSKNRVIDRISGREIYHKTLGIVGTGAIGQEVAIRAKGFQMKILGYDPYVKQEDISSCIQLVSLEKLMEESDIVSIHLPLMESTVGMFNESLLSHMKSDAILINAARGGLVNSSDLMKLMIKKKIHFVAEDVELTERDDVLIGMENYLITPHGASFTEEADRNTIDISVNNILEVLERKKDEE